MVKTKIITVGKLKEKAVKEIISEYEKRLSKYTDFSVCQIQDMSLNDNPSQKEIDTVLEKEGSLILKNMPANMVNVALTIDGKSNSSEEFSDFIEKNKINGGLCFIIGSSHGISKNVISKCQHKISLSKMTFPHNLARLILTEQIYRGFKILNNENYHK